MMKKSNDVARSALDKQNISAMLTGLNVPALVSFIKHIYGRVDVLVRRFGTGNSAGSSGIPLKRVAVFTRKLSVAIEAGVPLARALSRLSQYEQPKFKAVITDVGTRLSGGDSFSEALGKYPSVFSKSYVAAVNAASRAGVLGRVLADLATNLENAQKTRARVIGAMRYPMFMLLLLAGVVIVMVWKLVPTFEGLYQGFGAKLPLPTAILIGVARGLRTWAIVWIPILVVLIFGLRYVANKPRVKMWTAQLLLSLPYFGPLLRDYLSSVFTRTLALLLESRTPVAEAVELAANTIDNPVFNQRLKGIQDRIRSGEMLSVALEKTGCFGDLVPEMVATGEEVGSIHELLRKAVEYYDDEIKLAVESLSQMIEPVLILLIGAVIGFFIVLLYLPIFNMGSIVTG